MKSGGFFIELTHVPNRFVKGFGILFSFVMKPVADSMRFEIGFF